MERKGMKKHCLCKKIFVMASLVMLFSGMPLTAASSYGSTQALVEGLEAYKSGDWTGAVFLLRRAVSSSEYATADNYYMLIMSEMYAGDYVAAEKDCRYFLNSFSEPSLRAFVTYQRGRTLHYLGKNDEAVNVLSDFCHQNPDNEMYASALYWLAECFYDDYNYDTARTLYERVVTEFSEDAKASESEYKLEMISQREREQKLLYLLKMTGEEYLSARETYEKQLKQYESEDLQSLRRQLKVANDRIAELEAAASETIQAAKYTDAVQVKDPEVLSLKNKALQLQMLLDKKTGTEK